MPEIQSCHYICENFTSIEVMATLVLVVVLLCVISPTTLPFVGEDGDGCS